MADKNLNTALGRFRAIASKQTKALASRRGLVGPSPAEMGRGARIAGKKGKQVSRWLGRGGMSALRNLRDTIEGEYAGSSGLKEDLKIFGREMKPAVREVLDTSPIVGGARKVGKLVAHAKRGMAESRRRAREARADKSTVAREKLTSKPSEE